MASFLHLVKADSPPLANAVIERNLREPDARVTVVLLDGARAPVSAGAAVKRLGPDLDYNALLDLIFESDHVVTW
ncbi:MAG: hypothetical protein Q8P98_09250 [Candidatus Rokubacteria bacterium]|nr:hypothetical protein [Candidatus Rokubacteria bacterium]